MAIIGNIPYFQTNPNLSYSSVLQLQHSLHLSQFLQSRDKSNTEVSYIVRAMDSKKNRKVVFLIATIRRLLCDLEISNWHNRLMSEEHKAFNGVKVSLAVKIVKVMWNRFVCHRILKRFTFEVKRQEDHEAAKRLWIWEDTRPIAMAHSSIRDELLIRISPNSVAPRLEGKGAHRQTISRRLPHVTPIWGLIRHPEKSNIVDVGWSAFDHHVPHISHETYAVPFFGRAASRLLQFLHLLQMLGTFQAWSTGPAKTQWHWRGNM